MASSKILEGARASIRFIVDKKYPLTRINENSRLIKFINKFATVRSISNKDYSNTKLIDKQRTVMVTETLPFRVKFINIGIEGYGPGNPPPIGIAIIGFNNYIL